MELTTETLNNLETHTIGSDEEAKRYLDIFKDYKYLTDIIILSVSLYPRFALYFTPEEAINLFLPIFIRGFLMGRAFEQVAQLEEICEK